METANSTHETAPVARMAHALSFALWVSICSVAPEFIWQGLLANLHKLDWAGIGSVIVTGGIIAFFVEPLTERLRAFRLRLAHGHAPTTQATLVAFGLAVLAVFVHEAIAAFIEHPPSDYADKDSMAYAIAAVIQWAWIPFTTTLAWLGARKAFWVRAPLFMIAFASIVMVGPAYDWDFADSLSTALPCSAILIYGYLVVRRYRAEPPFVRCAKATALVAVVWLVVAGVLQLALSRFGTHGFSLYSWPEYTIDFRFYVGWVIGLAVAPQPIPR
jgi:hypothetical protein